MITILKINVNSKIGFDFDGVIIDHARAKIKLAKKFGFRIRAKDTPTECLENLIPAEIHKKIRKTIYGKITLKSKPVKNIPDTLRLLKKMGYELFIISQRTPYSARFARQWLKKYLKNIIPSNHLIFIGLNNKKNKICRKLKIKIFVEDKLKILSSLKSVPIKFLFDPYKIYQKSRTLLAAGYQTQPLLAKGSKPNRSKPRGILKVRDKPSANILTLHSWHQFILHLPRIPRSLLRG